MIVNNETIINNNSSGQSQGGDPWAGEGAGTDAPATTEVGSGAGWNDSSPPAGVGNSDGWDDDSPPASDGVNDGSF